jgi:hypothetical protein
MHVDVVTDNLRDAVRTCVRYGNGDDRHLRPWSVATCIGTLVKLSEENGVDVYGRGMIDNVGEGLFAQLEATAYRVQVFVVARDYIVVEVDMVGEGTVTVGHALAAWYACKINTQRVHLAVGDHVETVEVSLLLDIFNVVAICTRCAVRGGRVVLVAEYLVGSTGVQWSRCHCPNGVSLGRYKVLYKCVRRGRESLSGRPGIMHWRHVSQRLSRHPGGRPCAASDWSLIGGTDVLNLVIVGGHCPSQLKEWLEMGSGRCLE